ncbi:L-rhamnose 1-dehydrogenase (NADP(+)) [Candidatus Lokiarchaeum ossiferum]|uniref:L-rhamnose 1-dehydrogenase (NADP(+)) n=1 Tax=Candidatus Lokiarchaeum ossiferum TaxID=2951803 RepID=A0ABY6HUY8_9ARCH|nr:L-rhamnose 1-dehydrogenase (NADP(+)) [Candidatus Lokiarchaeum sp. B-35]
MLNNNYRLYQSELDMDLGLKGKNVLVTGATGGIGLVTVRKFIEEGAFVIAHYHHNTAEAERLQHEYSLSILTLGADLSDEIQVQEMFTTISQKVGKIDILVCNAGIWPKTDETVAQMSFKRWKRTQAVNLDSVFLCCRAFFHQLQTQIRESANIILIGSTAAIFGEAGHLDYSASKAALTYGFTKTLKNEIVKYARLGRVNTICPGWVKTPMSEDALADTKGVKKVLQTIPMRKIAQAEDIALSILSLASDVLSGHISGEILTVAGGMEGRILFSPTEIDLDAAF